EGIKTMNEHMWSYVLNKKSSRPISRTTVKRRLRQSGLHGQIAARKPLLRRGNKQKRFVWAKKHKEGTLDQWKSVLWSDESKFEIFGSNRRVFVRRRKGERMDSTCLVPTVKHGGEGVMVWVCFAGDTHGYHSILQRHAIPSGLRSVGRSFIFQQDNDPKHTSRLCKGLYIFIQTNVGGVILNSLNSMLIRLWSILRCIALV
uniref:Transposase Tc1-like domain-containing protein n=1 Tax=Myripristis murdjan TaxID=586833 RepID=A0A667YN29_9TELE